MFDKLIDVDAFNILVQIFSLPESAFTKKNTFSPMNPHRFSNDDITCPFLQGHYGWIWDYIMWDFDLVVADEIILTEPFHSFTMQLVSSQFVLHQLPVYI